jgi:hypothetical protein
MIEDKAGIKALYLPLYVHGMPGINDSFDLMDYWIEKINESVR